MLANPLNSGTSVILIIFNKSILENYSDFYGEIHYKYACLSLNNIKKGRLCLNFPFL